MARIRFYVDEGPPKVRETEQGRVDLFEHGIIQNVKAGQILAEADPEAEDFSPEEFPAGENVHVPRENPRVLVASVEGHAFWKDGKIHVSPLFVVEGDVDHHTGNLHFTGKLHIKGTVRAGFVIEAREAIVEGDVEGRVFTRRDLVVMGGIVSGRHKVICGGDLRASYIMNAHVEARGKVEVEKFIRESEVRSGETVKVLGTPGQILGGVVQARLGVEAKVLGSGLSATTTIIAGIDPFLERLIQGKLKEIEAQRAELERGIRDPERPFEEKFELEHRLLELDFYRSLLEENLYADEGKASIRILEKAFQGVTLGLGRQSLRLEDDLLGPVTLTLKGGKISP